jgi:transposase
MPKLIAARAAHNREEATKVKRLSTSRMAPLSLVQRAQMVMMSWAGDRVTAIAEKSGCHPQTVRERLKLFNAHGVDGLSDQPRSGRPVQINEHQRSQLIALVKQSPPGRLKRQADGSLESEDGNYAHWTLDALAQEARQLGISIGRSQVRRILLAEWIPWRQTRSWSEPMDPEFVPKEQRL